MWWKKVHTRSTDFLFGLKNCLGGVFASLDPLWRFTLIVHYIMLIFVICFLTQLLNKLE